MNYHEVEKRINAGYRAITEQYRRDDEVEVLSENHRRVAGVLKRICRSFSRPIYVLDVGCGTGRYFHCLESVASLTGLDISEDMLAAARHPVRQEAITVERITLRRGNAYLANFPPSSFDFIYSLGMFGHGCPITVEICDKFHNWLRPGGKLLFNAVDFAGLPAWFRLRRQARDCVYPLLPRSLRRILDQREQRSPFFRLTEKDLEELLRATAFREWTIASHPCSSPLWSGRHLECLAAKPALMAGQHQAGYLAHDYATAR